MEQSDLSLLSYVQFFNDYLLNDTSNHCYRYHIAAGYSIVQERINPDGTPKLSDGFDQYYPIGRLFYFKHDTEHECSFEISKKFLSTKPSKNKVYLGHIDNLYAKQSFRLILNHLRLINTDIPNRLLLGYYDFEQFEIFPVYVFDSLKKQVYQKIIFKFKAFQQFPECFVVVKNDKDSFETARNNIDNQFFIRYYSKVIEKKGATDKLTKSEKQIVKMYYY